MSQALSIASVTVVYNGARILPEHLDSLRRQTRKLDEMIVVNNASTDDTARLLKARYPEVTVLNLAENTGVGGGYAAGLEYAASCKKYDWIWLFDQDSVPADDALERLLAAGKELDGSGEKIGILAPLGTNEDTRLSYPLHVWRHGLGAVGPETVKEKIFFADSVISSGTLLRREAVEEVGPPRADFFMDFVDHEHCLRLRRSGYKIAVVMDSCFKHTLGDPRAVTVFGSRRLWATHAPWRQYYKVRNEIFTVWNYYPDWRTKCFTARRLLHEAMYVVLAEKRKLSHLKMMWHGVKDGLTGRLGIRFLPAAKETSTPPVADDHKETQLHGKAI